MATDSFYEFLLDFYKQMFKAIKPGGSFYIFHADNEAINFRKALEAAGGQVRECLIWVKNTFTLGRQDYQRRHEPCLYGWKEGAAHYFVDNRRQSTVIEDESYIDEMNINELRDALREVYFGDGIANTILHEDKPTKSELHPTMKPVNLIARLLLNSSKKGDIVFDGFGGSGTTMMAAEQLGRKAYLMELNPHYVDAILYRWEQYTGKNAVRVDA